jgi:hypothetical protein
VAKDTTNAWLQIAHAAGATTLTMRTITQAGTLLTTTGATVTAFIVDGANTESVVCSGNATGTTDGSTIACGATANAHGANAYVYFQVTASKGPTAYIPITKLEWSDDYVQLYDKGLRGSNTDVFGAVQGMRHGALLIDGDCFADSFGYLLGNFFGAYDYTATSGGNPTTYAFSILNTGNAQPTPYLFYDYNPGNSNTRVLARSVVTDLTIKADPGALLGYSATIAAMASGVVNNPATVPPAYSSFKVIPSRVGIATVGGSSGYKTLTYEINLKRANAGPIDTLQGNQDPTAIFVGEAQATAKATFVVDDDTEFTRYVNATQPTFLMTVNQGSGTAANGVKIQTTSSNYEQVKVMQTGGKGYVSVEVPFVAIANTTDASTAGGGLSPCLVTLSTGTTTGSTLY